MQFLNQIAVQDAGNQEWKNHLISYPTIDSKRCLTRRSNEVWMELAPLRCTLPQLAFGGERHSLRTPLATPLDWVSLVVVAPPSQYLCLVFSGVEVTLSQDQEVLIPKL